MGLAPALADFVGIGITTKNRWERLRYTLQQVREYGLAGLETIVIDDGSTVPMPESFRQEFSWVRFERSEKSQGLITQRNRIIRELKPPFYLSLDDDSYPVSGDLMKAALWLAQHPNVAVMKFPIILNEAPLRADLPAEPFPTQSFTGCGFLMRREIALKIGGLDERLIFYGEEADFCLHCLGEGYEVFYYPGMQIRHEPEQGDRNHGQRLYFANRAYMLLCFQYYPLGIAYIRALRIAPRYFREKWTRQYWRNILSGLVVGIVLHLRSTRKVRRLSASQFKDWDSRVADP